MKLTDEAENLALHQFKNSTKLNALIRGLIFPLEELEQELKNLREMPHIEKAEAKSLDILGRLVGQPRLDMNDEDYRAWIQVAIRLNMSSGTAEEVLQILSIIYQKKPEVLMHGYRPNYIGFTFLTLPKAPLQALLAIIQSACPLTIFCIFVRGHTRDSALFELSKFSQSNFCELIKENTI